MEPNFASHLLLHGHIKDITVENPACITIVVMNDHFIDNMKITYGEVFEPSEHFIMVACNIINFYAPREHTGDLDHLHMR